MPPVLPPIKNQKGAKKSKNKRSLLLILLIILALAVIGGAGFAYFKFHKHNNHNSSTNQSKAKTAPISSTTKHYVSNEQILNLAFNYPTNWKVSPASTQSGGSANITIKSPVTAITNSAGQLVSGQIVVSARPGSASINELVVNSATAAQTSAQVAYTSPATDQLQYPYLTFIQLSSTPNPGGNFNEVMVTGGTQFTQGDPIMPSSLASLDPVISAAFYACQQNNCSNQNNTISISYNTWQNSALFQQVQTMFESFVLN